MYERDLLPSYAGIHTFFRAPQEDFARLQAGDVAVMGVPWDNTLGSRAGCRYGPEAIRKASLRMEFYVGTSTTGELVNLDFERTLRRNSQTRIVDLGDLNVYLTDVHRTSASIKAGVAEAVRMGAFPVILGGDHYISYPCVQGVVEGLTARTRKPRLGYIQFDAHFDLGDESSLMGRLHQGSMARRISEMAEVSPSNMVWVGVRGYARKDQMEYLRSSGAHYFPATEIVRRGIRPIVEQAVEIASAGTDGVYISVDIDSVDPTLAPGTGVIAFGGITPMQLLEAMDIVKNANVVGFDLTEVAPNLDPTGVTENLASQAIFAFLSNRIFA